MGKNVKLFQLFDVRQAMLLMTNIRFIFGRSLFIHSIKNRAIVSHLIINSSYRDFSASMRTLFLIFFWWPVLCFIQWMHVTKSDGHPRR